MPKKIYDAIFIVLITAVAGLLIAIVFPHIRQEFHAWRNNDNIHVFAFGGYKEGNTLQPLRFLFTHVPHANYYELYKCIPGTLCGWPKDYELRPERPFVVAQDALLIFETAEYSARGYYMIVGRDAGNAVAVSGDDGGDSDGDVYSPVIKVDLVEMPSQLKPSWLRVDTIEKGDDEEKEFIAHVTWHNPEDAESPLVVIRREGLIHAVFFPEGSEYEAGDSRDIKYSLTDAKALHNLRPTFGYEFVLFYPREDGFAPYIAKYFW